MQKLKIVLQTPNWVIVDKPAGVSVHPPEQPDGDDVRVKSRRPDVIRMARAQLGQWVYPVHRLDRATSGLMVLALNPETAKNLQEQIQNRSFKKNYLLICRGWPADFGEINPPLKKLGMSAEHAQEAITQYQTLHRFELPVANKKFSTSRYSLVMAIPITGRTHQIRRHFKHISHPIIGDTIYGDGEHNRIWRGLAGQAPLYLKSWVMGFDWPQLDKKISQWSSFNGTWHRALDWVGFCPLWKSIIHE